MGSNSDLVRALSQTSYIVHIDRWPTGNRFVHFWPWPGGKLKAIGRRLSQVHSVAVRFTFTASRMLCVWPAFSDVYICHIGLATAGFGSLQSATPVEPFFFSV